jgi:hypothetical protein
MPRRAVPVVCRVAVALAIVAVLLVPAAGTILSQGGSWFPV